MPSTSRPFPTAAALEIEGKEVEEVLGIEVEEVREVLGVVVEEVIGGDRSGGVGSGGDGSRWSL